MIVGIDKFIALGDCICFLSLVKSINVPVTIKISDSLKDFNMTEKIISVFNLTNSFTVTYGKVSEEEKNNFDLLKHNKYFSRYIPSGMHEVVNRKPCIAIVTNSGQVKTREFFKNDKAKDSAWNKYQSLESYKHIFEIINYAGYDPIVLDSVQMPIELKVDLINSYCDGVIGYEGGLMHVAHVLKVPAIILPAVDIPDEMQSFYHSTHLDKRTYFLKNMNEIAGWDETRFSSVIESLKNEKGNNIYFSTPVGVSWLMKNLTPMQQAFQQTHLQKLTVGGF